MSSEYFEVPCVEPHLGRIPLHSLTSFSRARHISVNDPFTRHLSEILRSITQFLEWWILLSNELRHLLILNWIEIENMRWVVFLTSSCLDSARHRLISSWIFMRSALTRYVQISHFELEEFFLLKSVFHGKKLSKTPTANMFRFGFL